MKEIILIKNGEIALKGLNRHTFETVLMKNIKWRIKNLGNFNIKKSQSTIYITPLDDNIDLDEVCDRVSKVFGIAAFSRCCVVEKKDIEEIKKIALEYCKESLENAKTFKVFAKRADKQFPYKSPEIQQIIGDVLYTNFPHLKVDVRNPEVSITIEVREEHAYIHASSIKGAGGMPVSTSGEGLLMISGGIDSPVAGYLMARRGLKTSAIHFVSPPYTSDRALEKVETLLEKLTPYTGNIQFYCVNFTKIQEAIKDNCEDELFTIIMRRIMMRIAIAVAEEMDIPCLITGESLAQVASQTVYALNTTDAVTDRVIFRPLIGLDKQDIIEYAKKIDTFETSILPYEDCCTVFTPKHPKTRPTLKYVEDSESVFDFEPLIKEAINSIDKKNIKIPL